MILFPTGITLTDDQAACLENDLVDIETWITEAIAGKINNCKKRLLREWQPRLFADPTIDTLPADETALIKLIMARPDYKNRVARDAAAAGIQP